MPVTQNADNGTIIADDVFTVDQPGYSSPLTVQRTAAAAFAGAPVALVSANASEQTGTSYRHTSIWRKA